MIPVRRTNEGWIPEIFNDFFDTEWLQKAKGTVPAINVTESADEYCVEVAAPGMRKEDFNIMINEDNDLVISMEKKSDSDEKESNKKDVRYLRREFAYSKFQQALVLPDDVDKTKIGAKMDNGILTIDLPKIVVKEEPKVSHKIDIL